MTEPWESAPVRKKFHPDAKEGWKVIRPGLAERILVNTSGPSRKKEREVYCSECYEHQPAFFSLRDEIWEQTKLGKTIACVRCAERALGRNLQRSDFKPIPINDLFFVGWINAKLEKPEYEHRIPTEDL